MNKVFKWNGAEFKFSALDANMMEKFDPITQKAAEELDKYEKEHGSDGTIDAEGVRAECEIIDKMFDLILGEGAAKRMFYDLDLYERVAAFNKLTKMKEMQIKRYEALITSITNTKEE